MTCATPLARDRHSGARRLPVRQWVLAVPKRLRYFLQRDADLQGAALRQFLRAVEQCLRAHIHRAIVHSN